MQKKIFIALLTLALVGGASSAFAIPALQTYIDGATYDPVTETWVTAAGTFNLWVIGDVGGYGNILDVALAAAVYTAESGTGTITLTPTTASGLPAPGDPSTPAAPTYNGLSASGDRPQLNDGSYLAWHGVYGPAVRFHEWEIGDLTLTDSPVGDFNGDDPFPLSFPSTGQINAYTVTVTGYTAVHFDVYNTIEGRPHSSFGPFSHDAGSQLIPEPSSMLLLGLGLLGFSVVGRRFRRSRK